MKYAQLTQYFEKLEQTSSRLSLIETLSELFKELDPTEVPMVAYLLQGRIAPFYEPIELGMAEKSVASAMARVYAKDREHVLKVIDQTGDIGNAAEKLAKESRIENQELSIKEVFDSLKKIADFKGDGTVEKKTATLSELLEKLTPIEAKHLVRIPLGTTRLGIGDPTILDAFATAKLGDKSKRKLLEGAYNKVSDLGLIGEVLWAKGLEAVEKLDVTVGRPIRSQLCERIDDINKLTEKYGGTAHLQYKYDGFRAQIHKDGNQIRIFSRNLEETTDSLPDVIKGVLTQVKAKTAIFDAEALAFNPESDEFLPFQETMKRKRKYGIEEAAIKAPLKAFVFDIMFYEGKALVDKPLTERIEILKKAIHGDDVLVVQPGEITEKSERINELFQDALTKGLEGLIVKRPDSTYEAGARNSNWIKIKRNTQGNLSDTIDCVILGYVYGRGKRADFGAGALLVGIYDKDKDEYVTVSKLGTGLTDDEWREIHKRADKIKVDKKPARVSSILEPSVWIKPEIVIEVIADEITRSPIHTAGKEGSEPGYALRFPRLVKFREDDKSAEDSTSVEELKEMFSQQYKKG
jgi:DNA ligase 1